MHMCTVYMHASNCVHACKSVSVHHINIVGMYCLYMHMMQYILFMFGGHGNSHYFFVSFRILIMIPFSLLFDQNTESVSKKIETWMVFQLDIWEEKFQDGRKVSRNSWGGGSQRCGFDRIRRTPPPASWTSWTARWWRRLSTRWDSALCSTATLKEYRLHKWTSQTRGDCSCNPRTKVCYAMPEEAKRLEAHIYRAGAHPQSSEYKEASFWCRAQIDRSNAQIEYKEYMESLVSLFEGRRSPAETSLFWR